MLKVKTKWIRVVYSIPLLQIGLIVLHYALGLDAFSVVYNTLTLTVSLLMAALFLMTFMSRNKSRQLAVFYGDRDKESIMIEKIKHAKNLTSHATDQTEGETYRDFLNLYFSCFSHQPKQIALLILNWGTCLMVIINILLPLAGVGSETGLSSITAFILLFILLFAIASYFYALYLKTKMEALIIEDFVSKRHSK